MERLTFLAGTVRCSLPPLAAEAQKFTAWCPTCQHPTTGPQIEAFRRPPELGYVEAERDLCYGCRDGHPDRFAQLEVELSVEDPIGSLPWWDVAPCKARPPRSDVVAVSVDPVERLSVVLLVPGGMSPRNLCHPSSPGTIQLLKEAALPSRGRSDLE